MKCNMDCFNCPYPDCWKDKRVLKEPKKRGRKKSLEGSYYDRHKEERRAYQNEYNASHRKERRAYQTEYYKNNTEYAKEYSKKHYRKLCENPEFVEQRRKEAEEKRRKARLQKEMFTYDLLKTATRNMLSAAGTLDSRDLLVHVLTIVIDRWTYDRGKDTNYAIGIADDVLDVLIEQKNAQKGEKDAKMQRVAKNYG